MINCQESFLTSKENLAPSTQDNSLLPLNSKHVKLPYLNQLAHMMNLPTKASGSQLLQKIEGKLSTVGRQPANIQVNIEQREDAGVHLSLEDATEIFLQAPPDEEELETEGSDGSTPTH